MTPFEEFYFKVRDLIDSDVARQLSLYKDHPIYGPLEQLYDATYSVSVLHGKEGPDTTWNRPFRKAGSDFSGSNHSNSSRPSTPIRNNGGLHPNWPNTPPHSRPGSWSSLGKMQQLEAENHGLKLKLDNYKEELRQAREECKAATNKKVLELEAQILKHGATIERVRLRSAKAYFQFKTYESAASEYEQLALLKQDEKALKAGLKDEEGRRKAEDDETLYMFEQAKALASDEKYEKAEKIFKTVRSTKARLGSHRVAAVDAHDVRSRLCEIFLRQDKTSEAKMLFLDAAAPLELGTLNTRSPADCTWVLQNAMSYTRLLTKERDYDRAGYWMKRIWPNRQHATTQGLRNIETETLNIAGMLEHRGQAKQQMKHLEIICSNNVAPLSEPILYCYARLGSLYNNCARSNEDFANAAAYLRQAWNERQRLDVHLLRSTGWTLALTLLRLKIHQDARDILRELQCLNVNNPPNEAPTNSQVQALLAHTHLISSDFTAAETTAAKAFKLCGTRDIFAGLSSSALDLSAFHPASTLIQARARQKTREKFIEAKTTWTAIYEARQSILGVDKSGREQLSKHAAAAKVLADEWELYAKKIGKTPATANAIRAEIRKVDALTR